MKLIDKLKNLLKKETSSHEIISINQIITIPTRESFSQNKRIIDLIENYKAEYKSILSQLKYLTSLDIHSKNISQDISMNTDLLLKIFFNSDEIKQLTLKDKIDYLVNIRKLNLCSIAISDLEIEVIARLIALNEIYNERKAFLPRYKKNAITNEINNLSVSMLLFTNKKLAIELEKKHYLTTAIYNIEKMNNPREEASLIAKKRIFLLNITQALLPENNIKISEDTEHILDDIAEVEKMIEIYVYKHKNDVETLKEKLEFISENDIDITNKEEVLSSIKNLEYMYLAFYQYGREYIAIDDLMQLYLLKFNVLVLSENGVCETFVDENTTEIELECYKGIIEREIESFIKGETTLNNPIIIKIIINILKKNSDTLDAEEILTDKYLLNVLLSMGSKESLINLLKKFKVKKVKNDYFDFCEEIFEWEEELPLETIYRLMLSQNVGYDAELYEYLQSDIYPNSEYYILPVGLRGINYCTEIAVGRHVLHGSTLLIIQKMRELMNNKYIVCPFTLVYIKNGVDFFKTANIKNILFYEGLEVNPYDTKDIKVLERNESKIIVYNMETNEIITSDLNCHIRGKWGSFSAAGLLTHIPNRNFFIEEYNSYEYEDSPLEKRKNAIAARKNDETRIFSRAYIDVSTKFGDFCLHIEEKNTKDWYGPYISISLYHGHHEMIIDKLNNDFNWPEYGIFRTKYMKKNDFYQWMLGFVDSVWSHPFRNIWSYGETKSKDKKCDSPIYSFSEYQGNGKRGTIFIDGTLKLKDNVECIPDMFENLEVDEYEYQAYESKAYFGTSSKHVAILKQLEAIKIIYKERNRRTGIFEEKAKADIGSITRFEFIEDDFEKIISVLNTMSIDQDLRKFIIDEIKTYISIHYSKNGSFFIRDRSNIENFPIKLADFLKREDFVGLLDLLDDTNANDFVEMLIENITRIFHISISDLLGNPPIERNKGQKMAETMKRLLLSKKDNR